MANIDLFGNEIIDDVLLMDKYIEPPFTRLDAVGGNWQNRKRKWIARGLKSEIGREAKAFNLSNWVNEKSFNGDKLKSDVSIFDPVLCEVLYHWFCAEGGTILDPFAGSCSTLKTAKALNRNCKGSELSKEFCQMYADFENGLLL